MKILYVEDNDDNIAMLEARLVKSGHSVLVATDGAQGIEMREPSIPSSSSWT